MLLPPEMITRERVRQLRAWDRITKKKCQPIMQKAAGSLLASHFILFSMSVIVVKAVDFQEMLSVLHGSQVKLYLLTLTVLIELPFWTVWFHSGWHRACLFKTARRF